MFFSRSNFKSFSSPKPLVVLETGEMIIPLQNTMNLGHRGPSKIRRWPIGLAVFNLLIIAFVFFLDCSIVGLCANLEMAFEEKLMTEALTFTEWGPFIFLGGGRQHFSPSPIPPLNPVAVQNLSTTPSPVTSPCLNKSNQG